MDRNAVLAVTMFMLAQTLGVTGSQSAATGRHTLIISPNEALGGGSSPLQQRDDDTDLLFRPAGFSASAASSIESAVPDWINLRPGKDGAGDENDDLGNDAEEWKETPLLLSPEEERFRYDPAGERRDAPGPRDPVLLTQQQQRPFLIHNGNFNKNRMMLPTPEDLDALRHYYQGGKVAVGGGFMKRGDKLKRIYLATKLREQEAAALPSASTRMVKSNFRVPAESNIVRENFDKRSPRCIANCMKQGLVHPIQCHSLCRKR